MEALIHYVSLEDVLRQPDALLAPCGASGDWTTKQSLVTCPDCRERIEVARPEPRARPCAGGELPAAGVRSGRGGR
jgi:hypothetical protein